jgi:hypothetical protein
LHRPRGVAILPPPTGHDPKAFSYLISTLTGDTVTMGFRRAARLAALLACALAARAGTASAAAEVHRLSLMLSSNPGSVTADDFNQFLGDFNRTLLQPRGMENIEKLSFGWFHQAELRYFVRPNLALSFGAGQLKTESRREFLPRISQVIQLHASVLSVPIHVGAAYYLTPYNQGDFQARAYFGGGFMSLTNNKASFRKSEVNTDSATAIPNGDQRESDVRGIEIRPGDLSLEGRGDAPGYYLEVGGHMFFAARYSVMLGGIYRSAKIRDLEVELEEVDPETGQVSRRKVTNVPFSLDLSGLGFRMAIGLGF